LIHQIFSGCLSFFQNGLENNWSSFVETMENLVASRNKETVDKTIKTLDGKLSEAIMYAMSNGPALEMKVKTNLKLIYFNLITIILLK
jgi:dally